MSYIRPVKNLPSNLSWPHFLSSVGNLAAFSSSDNCFIKLFGGKAKDSENLGKGVVKITSKRFSMEAVLKKVPKESTLVYAGNMVVRNKDYENQFVRLSFMAIPDLLNRFRDFNETLLRRMENGDFVRETKGFNSRIILQETSGKCRELGNVEDIAQDRVKEWVKIVKEYLENPFKEELSLPFPRAFGGSRLNMRDNSVSGYKTNYFKLSDTRYFNLNEINELNSFLNEIISKSDTPPSIHLLSSSSVIDYLFYTRFKDKIDKESFKSEFVSKWVAGYEPMLYLMEALKKDTSKIIVNMSDLPLIEVLSFE